LALKVTDTEVTCFGILSSECRGVSSYKDKEWKPAGQKATYRVYAKEKQQWDKDTSKYIKVDVSKDEGLLYKVLSDKAKEGDDLIFTGNITPWVNPFIYELDATDDANIVMLKKLTSQLAILAVHPGPHELTQAEIAIALDATSTSKKGTYSKPETESEHLQARYDFFQAQLADMFEFTSFYDLAGQIVAMSDGVEQLSPDRILEKSIEKTLELLKIVMGN